MTTSRPATTDDAATAAERHAHLEAEVDRARARVRELEIEYDELLGNRDVIQEDRDTVRRILEEARGVLAAAERSLAQEATGEYGLCVKCGEPIGAERLEALPDTTTCRSCA